MKISSTVMTREKIEWAISTLKRMGRDMTSNDIRAAMRVLDQKSMSMDYIDAAFQIAAEHGCVELVESRQGKNRLNHVWRYVHDELPESVKSSDMTSRRDGTAAIVDIVQAIHSEIGRDVTSLLGLVKELRNDVACLKEKIEQSSSSL